MEVKGQGSRSQQAQVCGGEVIPGRGVEVQFLVLKLFQVVIGTPEKNLLEPILQVNRPTLTEHWSTAR